MRAFCCLRAPVARSDQAAATASTGGNACFAGLPATGAPTLHLQLGFAENDKKIPGRVARDFIHLMSTSSARSKHPAFATTGNTSVGHGAIRPDQLDRIADPEHVKEE